MFHKFSGCKQLERNLDLIVIYNAYSCYTAVLMYSIKVVRISMLNIDKL